MSCLSYAPEQTLNRIKIVLWNIPTFGDVSLVPWLSLLYSKYDCGFVVFFFFLKYLRPSFSYLYFYLFISVRNTGAQSVTKKIVYYSQGFMYDTLPFVKHEYPQGVLEKSLCVTDCWVRVKWHVI